MLSISVEEDCSELEKIEISLLLEGIYRYYGHDFRNYVFPSVRRRIIQRCRLEKCESISELTNKLLHEPDCMMRLFQDFLINVTEMFRDPSFFLSFRENVVPKLRDYEDIRIWHAGCSTGEEAYSMAILLDEEGLYSRSRLYATDINEGYLERAREGSYPLAQMKNYTKNYQQAGGKRAFSEYYTVKDGRVRFKSSLSENILFAPHNLVTDKSFNEFHVIICRNVLIYFDSTLQKRVQRLFVDSLVSGGFLGLGRKESIKFSGQAHNYQAIDTRENIFQKVRECF